MARKITKKATKKTTKKADEIIYRVVPLPPVVRDALKAARADHGTNMATLTAAVGNLPHLLTALARLGIGKASTGARCKKYRLPFAEADLKALRAASDETGLDATLLLKALVAGL